jgi:phosphate transport system permease protein
MDMSFLFLTIAALTVFGYFFGQRRVVATSSRASVRPHSLPSYSGFYVALWCGIPSLILVLAWQALEPRIVLSMVMDGLPADLRAQSAEKLALLETEIRTVATGRGVNMTPSQAVQDAALRYRSLHATAELAMWGVVLSAAILGVLFAYQRLAPQFRARQHVEKIVMIILIICSTLAVLTTVGIVMSLLFEAGQFFAKVPVFEFLFGLQWSPQIAIRTDQVGGSGAFGAVPLFVGTLLITVIAMVVAIPIGLMSAIYLADYAPARVRDMVKPALEILAGIPTVVYGFFAALTVAPFVRDAGAAIGLDVASESALAAGLVMGLMLVPFVSSLSDDVINAVPQSLRDGSAGLGATKSETIRQVILPAALPGIVGAVMLAISKAIGETMIVVMAAGLAANLTLNPIEAVTTVTVQIASLLVGDQEADSPKTLAAFALGLVLFAVTLVLNVIAIKVVHKYREKYD